jgi:excisionase family DNA binding protein
MSSLNEPSNNELDVLLKGNDVARILNISRSMAYQLIQRGEIRSLQIGRSVRVQPKDLKDFISQRVGSKQLQAEYSIYPGKK